MSLKVKIRVHGNLKHKLGQDINLELNAGSTFKDLLIKLGGNIISETAYIHSIKMTETTLSVLINGRNIHALNGIDTLLKEEDVITIIPVIIGG
jgi:molybdopterin converting factor small subunit